MRTRKIQNYLIVITLFVALISCRQELELAGRSYYYTIKEERPQNWSAHSYFLCNDEVTLLGEVAITSVDENGRFPTGAETTYINDCFKTQDKTCYTGAHNVIKACYNETLGTTVDSMFSCEPFIEVNGTKKFFDLPGFAEGLIIGNDGDDIFYIFRSTVPGENYTYEAYYLSVNGEEPTKIAEQQEEIYSIRKAEIKRCKKHGDKLYFVGVKDRVGFYCEANNVRTPFYLTDYNGGAYDIAFGDSVILTCGHNQGKAYVWENCSPIELEFPNYAVESEARALAIVGDDVYVGGRIDECPVIWKNGKIYATWWEAPPVTSEYFLEGTAQATDRKKVKEEWAYVIDMVIDGDMIYSICETNNWTNDKKRFALEWHFENGKVSCRYDYDLVEMLRNGQIQMDSSFYSTSKEGWIMWPRCSYGTPHIALNHVKTKAKRKK